MVMVRTVRGPDVRLQLLTAVADHRRVGAMLAVVPKSLLTIVAAVLAAAVLPSSAWAADRSAESRAAWDHVSASRRAPTPATPQVRPKRFAAFTLDQDALAQVLRAAPVERRRGRTVTTPSDGLEVSIPDPSGGFQRFAVVDAPVMEPGLAAEHPEISTFAGRGIDDPTASVRFDLTPAGFHASVRSGDAGGWYVDPQYADRSQYVAYDRGDLAADPYERFVEREAPEVASLPATGQRTGEPNGSPVTLRVYRLALVSDPTYAANTPGTTTDAKVTLLTRIDQIYEQELAIRMELVAGNDQLNLDTAAQATGTSGPCAPAACFTSTQIAACDSPTLTRNTAVAGHVIGGGNFDLAHLVLGVNGGGIAGLGVVGTSSKGAGCTGVPTPTGDAFAVDYVAHEMGHQFGADHSFNGNNGNAVDGANCNASNRASSGNAAQRVEPGSGSSIMAYAGICGQDDLQPHSDPYFSEASITRIATYVTAAESAQSPVQQVALNGFSGTDSFALSYAGGTSATITRGGNYTAAGIQAAIMAISGWPAGASVSVSAPDDDGFTVAFSGIASPAALSVVNASGVTGFTGTVAVAGTTTRRGSTTTTDNHTPSVGVVLGGTAIPARTPFVLDAAGSDLDAADAGALTYMWEQNDPGGSVGIPLVSNSKANGPLFRMFGESAVYGNAAAHQSPSPGQNIATGTTWRSFPDVEQVLADNTNAATGTCPAAPASGAVPQATVDCYSEFLPTSAWVGSGNRVLHFRVSVRDDHPGYGGIGTADTTLTVAPAAGPFRVTSQSSPTTLTGGDPLPVTWSVAGTDASPVSTANVRITMSVDGGQTWTQTLAASTPNDGAETVTVPRSIATTQARIRVEAINNVFYDVNKADLTVAEASPAVVTGPTTADLGSATVGSAAAPVAVTFSSTGSSAATLGPIALGGADASAVSVASDSCSSVTLAAGATCVVTLRLTPTHPGAHAATLSLPSDDLHSPAVVSLQGTGVAPTTETQPSPPGPTPTPTNPTPPPTPVTPPTITPTAPSAADVAAALLGVKAPVAAGSAGALRLFTPSTSAKLGRPKASKAIAAAVCSGGTCAGKATAKLALTPKAKGKKKAYTLTLNKALKLADGQGAKLTLKLSRTYRKRIKAARKATLTLTVTNATRKVTKTFTLTTG
jgi:hypothetical protein